MNQKSIDKFNKKVKMFIKNHGKISTTRTMNYLIPRVEIETDNGLLVRFSILESLYKNLLRGMILFITRREMVFMMKQIEKENKKKIK